MFATAIGLMTRRALVGAVALSGLLHAGGACSLSTQPEFVASLTPLEAVVKAPRLSKFRGQPVAGPTKVLESVVKGRRSSKFQVRATASEEKVMESVVKARRAPKFQLGVTESKPTTTAVSGIPRNAVEG
jgi:hypothetical protein